MPGKPATDRQRLEAARMLAHGETVVATARATDVSLRTLRRWKNADAAFARLVAKARSEQERTAHSNARRSARRHGLPVPTSPAQGRAIRAEHERAAEELKRAYHEAALRATQTTGAPAAEVLAWVLAQPTQNESDWLDRRDAERGHVSRRARLRFEGRFTPPQVRVIPLDTNASIMAANMRTPEWVRDPFEGMYDRLT